MRERMFDRYPGGPDDGPDAPEDCVVCHAPLPEDAQGVVTGHNNDGHTCSAPCHATWLQGETEHRAAEQAADAALWEEWKRDHG